MNFEKIEIDPVQYGVLWQKVQDMDKKMDKLERNVEELVELANKSKGGLWFGMSVVSGVSAVVGFVLSHWKDH
ncbi:MAG: hypothetical protein ACO3S8_07380 [Aquiluna sp.]